MCFNAMISILMMIIKCTSWPTGSNPWFRCSKTVLRCEAGAVSMELRLWSLWYTCQTTKTSKYKFNASVSILMHIYVHYVPLFENENSAPKITVTEGEERRKFTSVYKVHTTTNQISVHTCTERVLAKAAIHENQFSILIEGPWNNHLQCFTYFPDFWHNSRIFSAKFWQVFSRAPENM